ncbi:MAG: hypothetical protein JRI23_03850, partial [Deltaproteobacteria bacterium]|nr:hypothetical protein [Deltaproteobacteria bacterium]MBW2530662.1 hypothetical protein [Deltaproteobacteria bacterium]
STGVCGDGVIQRPETCDDANGNDTDGCTNDCKFVCEDFGGVQRLDDDHCYRAFDTYLTWHAARSACRQLNGGGGFDLVALSTIAEITWVQSQPALIGMGSYWTGGTDAQVQNTFVWTNGEPWTYTAHQEPWATQYEPNGGTIEDCVQAYDGLVGNGPTYVLNDVNCGWTETFLCEWTPPNADAVDP